MTSLESHARVHYQVRTASITWYLAKGMEAPETVPRSNLSSYTRLRVASQQTSRSSGTREQLLACSVSDAVLSKCLGDRSSKT